jgi:hypothetical protein
VEREREREHSDREKIYLQHNKLRSSSREQRTQKTHRQTEHKDTDTQNDTHTHRTAHTDTHDRGKDTEKKQTTQRGTNIYFVKVWS